MTNTPHDKLAKAVFADARQAAAFFRGFLPPPIVSRIDLDSLQLEPGTFVDEELGERLTDLLFKVAIGAGFGFLYLLLEHQSTPDRIMPFRLLRSIVRIQDRCLRGHEGTRSLPPVLPLVLYHGDRPWTVPVCLTQMMACDEDTLGRLWPYLPELRFLLIDLSAMTDAELRSRVVADAAYGLLALLLVKNYRAPDLLSRMREWADLLRDLLAAPSGLRALEVLLRYVFEVAGDAVSPGDLQAVLVHAEAGRDAEEAVMSLAEKLRREGLERGLERGLEQGHRLGAEEALIRLLRARFGELDVASRARIAAADLDTLRLWFGLALEAGSVAEVLAD